MRVVFPPDEAFDIGSCAIRGAAAPHRASLWRYDLWNLNLFFPLIDQFMYSYIFIYPSIYFSLYFYLCHIVSIA